MYKKIYLKPSNIAYVFLKCFLFIAFFSVCLNSSYAISPENLAKNVIEKIKQENSRNVISDFFKKDKVSTKKIGLPQSILEELKRNQEDAMRYYPKENKDAQEKLQREKFQRAEFYLESVEIKGKKAKAYIRQVLDDKVFNVELNMRYIEDNWYVDHEVPSSLGIFI